MSKLDSTLGPDLDDTPEHAEIMPVQSSWSDTVIIPEGETVSYPFLTLVQGNNELVADNKARAGEWYVDGFGSMAAVTIVPWQMAYSRRYAIKEGQEKPKTACYAPATGDPRDLHGIAVRGMEDDAPATLCSECPMSDWVPGTDKNGKAINLSPPCKDSLEYLVWSIEHAMPLRVQFRSSGMKKGKLIRSLAASQGLKNFAVRLGAIKATGAFVYFEPTVTILKPEETLEAVSNAQTFMALGPG